MYRAAPEHRAKETDTMKKSKTVNVTTWAGYITICNVRRIEQDHLFWYIWSGNKLEPEIISKGAGKLTVEEIEI